MREARIRDTLSGEVRPLEPREAGRAGIYACGPTVYSRIHVGNARPYVIFTLLPRDMTHSPAMAYAAMATVLAVITHRALAGRFGKLALMQSRIMVLGTGAVNALWRNRFADQGDLDAAVARLKAVPMKVGGWEGTDRPFDVEPYRAAGIRGALNRVYRNPDTGEVIEFQSEEIERLQAEVARKLGYKLVDHRLELYAVPLKDEKNG